MKKLFIFMLAIMVACFCIPIANASDEPSLEVYSADATSTSVGSLTAVATTTIIPGKHRILGYQISPMTSGSGTIIAGLYDSTAAATGRFAECAGANTGPIDAVWFPHPKSLSNGLVIGLGPGTSIVVYYEKTVP